MIAFLTYLLLFLVPLIILPGFNLRFEPPKVLISEFLIELIVVYSLLKGKFSLKRVDKHLAFIVGGLFILSLAHLILEPSKENLFGNIFRLQGTILFWHFLALAAVTQNVSFKLREKYIFLTSLLAVCIGGLIFGSNSAGRWIGSLGEPNAFGAVVILIFPFFFLSFKRVWIRVIGVIGVVGVINFTESKSALIALGLELLFLGLVKLFKGRYLSAVMICLSLIVLSLTLPVAERQYFLSTNTDPQNFRFEDRTEIWQVAVFAGIESPLIGSGLESVQARINETAKKLNLNAQYQVIDSSHNIFLDFWVWGGLIGLGLFLSLVILTLKNLIQKKMILEATVFLGLLVVLSFNPTTVTVLAAFWWIIGRSFAGDEDN